MCLPGKFRQECVLSQLRHRLLWLLQDIFLPLAACSTLWVFHGIKSRKEFFNTRWEKKKQPNQVGKVQEDYFFFFAETSMWKKDCRDRTDGGEERRSCLLFQHWLWAQLLEPNKPRQSGYSIDYIFSESFCTTVPGKTKKNPSLENARRHSLTKFFFYIDFAWKKYLRLAF